MLRQLAHVTPVLLFGGLAEIFELDVFLEFGDRRIVCFMHRPGSLPSSEGDFPANQQNNERRSFFHLPRSGSVQLFAGANGGGRHCFADSRARCPPPSLTFSLGGTIP